MFLMSGYALIVRVFVDSGFSHTSRSDFSSQNGWHFLTSGGHVLEGVSSSNQSLPYECMVTP